MLILLYFITVFISAIIVVAVANYPSYKRRKELLDKIPSPKGLPIIGHALEIRSTVDTYAKFKKWSAELGSLFKIKMGPSIMYITSDIGLIEFILTKTVGANKKAKLYNFSRTWLGDGLALSTGEKHQIHKKAIQPIFHIKLLEQYVPKFEKHIRILIKSLRKEEGKGSIEITNYTNLYTLDIICETTIDVYINSQENKNSPYVNALRFLLQNIMDRSFSLLGQTNFTYFFTKAYKEERKQLKVVETFIDSIIKERREELIKFQKTKEKEFSFKHRKTLLDILLLQTTMTDQDIKDEVNTFMIAGYETSAWTLNFALYCLSNHHLIQNIAYEEVHSIFQDDINRQCTYADLNNMKYMEKIIKETLRLYPAVPFVGREIAEDFEYKGNVFLKGSDIFLYFQGVHLDPSNFINPQNFDPERWNNDEEKHTSYSYLPFSAGHRACIGQKYAMMALKCVLAKILLNFEIVCSSPLKQPILSLEGSLKSINGIYVGLKKRINN